MEKSSRIYVAGHAGMVGSAIVRKLTKEGYSNLIFRKSSELDLRSQSSVESFFKQERPEYVFLAAAKVGGILANNSFRADFLYDNLMIETNVIHQSYVYKVKKLLFLGSSCIFPKLAPQPLKEESLLSGFLEETNEPYAIAKIAGIKLCENYRRQYGCDFISAMPCNLYGPNDNYDLSNSHVIPSLLRKFHEARRENKSTVVIWGTGAPRREFMNVEDLADACMFLMNSYSDTRFVNVGTGTDITIGELAQLIREISGFKGEIVFDHTKPDGTPRKLLDVSRIKGMGWQHSIALKEGLQRTFEMKYSSQVK